MKKIIAFILFFILWVPVYSQEPVKIYLPLILNELPECGINMNNGWSFVAPIESTNYVLNPSAEISGNFSALGGATVTRSSTYQKYGLYSYRVQTGSNAQGISLTLSALTNSVHSVTFRVRGQLPVRTKVIIGTGLRAPQFIEKIDNNWDLYGANFNATESNARTELRIIQQGNGRGDFYVDGIQVEPLATWSTYIDGTQEGCAWNGPEHAASSTRSGLSLAGGQVKDFYDDYGFFVEKIIGAGAMPQTNNIDNYAILPGGELNSIKILPRDMTIVGKFIADSELELHDKQQALHLALSSENYPNNQSFKLRFNGARVQKEIEVNYKGGLEGDLGAFYCRTQPEGDSDWAELNKWIEKASIQLQAPDPYWYETGESAAFLDANDSATFRIVAGRLKSTGQWSNLGPPNAAGTYTVVYALAEDETYLYIGGDFLNFDNIANADYIVRYNKQTGTYSALDVGLNGIVYSLEVSPIGDLYIGGAFTNAGGVAAADYLTRWNGTNFNAVGVPLTGAAAISNVRALVFDHTGNLYIGGEYTNWSNIASADNIVMWNGGAYSALSTGVDNSVFALAVDLNNNLILGGGFTSPVSRFASWDGSSFTELGDATIDGEIRALAIDGTNIIYLGGSFSARLKSWNGTMLSSLGSGVNNTVFGLATDKANNLFAVGTFSTAGSISLTDRMARWNQYAWAHLDINLPSSPAPAIDTILISKYTDPVIEKKYDLFVAFEASGTGNFAGKTTVNNEGSAIAFPKIVFKRTGGTTITIETLKNETIGKELLLDYGLQDGEKLTIDLTPTEKSVISNYFGPRLDAILANSDFGTWVLMPGNNNITCFAADQFALYPSSLDSYLLWRDRYKSYN